VSLFKFAIKCRIICDKMQNYLTNNHRKSFDMDHNVDGRVDDTHIVIDDNFGRIHSRAV
jgi:hypothetical protein